MLERKPHRFLLDNRTTTRVKERLEDDYGEVFSSIHKATTSYSRTSRLVLDVFKMITEKYFRPYARRHFLLVDLAVDSGCFPGYLGLSHREMKCDRKEKQVIGIDRKAREEFLDAIFWIRSSRNQST